MTKVDMKSTEYYKSGRHKEQCLENLKRFVKEECLHCHKSIGRNNLAKHIRVCPMNPDNLKECPVCQKKSSFSGKTCSYACSNTFFRSGRNNPNWKEDAYKSTCFEFHKKECVVCGEDKIVAVHHLDENHSNNSPENLIPMCPTHHQYWHSKYKELVFDKVMSYIDSWKKETDNKKVL